MRTLLVSFGGAHPANITKTRSLTWTQLCAWLVKEPPELPDKAARGWYCGAEFDPAYRHSDNFVSRHLLTWDFDIVGPEVWASVGTFLQGRAYAMYTTYSHTPERPRFRVVLPLSRPTGFDEFQAVSRKLAEEIGIEWVARESHVPAQFMYAPARPVGGTHEQDYAVSGAWVDVDAVLGQYADWTDRTTWPHRQDGDSLHDQETTTRPLDKPGIVGDFCRAFPISKAIEQFGLPYERVR